MRVMYGIAAALAAAIVGAPALAGPLAYPESPRRPVQDSFHGTVVAEDYRWLEQSDSSEAVAWIAAQNRLTHGVLDALPKRPAIKRELLGMLGNGRASRFSFDVAGSQLFALKRQPPKNQNMLVVMNSNATLRTRRGKQECPKRDGKSVNRHLVT